MTNQCDVLLEFQALLDDCTGLKRIGRCSSPLFNLSTNTHVLDRIQCAKLIELSSFNDEKDVESATMEEDGRGGQDTGLAAAQESLQNGAAPFRTTKGPERSFLLCVPFSQAKKSSQRSVDHAVVYAM